MGAVGVDAGLEPGPGVHELHEREAGGDLTDHGSGSGQGHLVLGHSSGHGVDAGLGTQVADSGTVALTSLYSFTSQTVIRKEPRFIENYL